MPTLWLYLGGLLLAIIVINVVVVRTIRGEQRSLEERRGKRPR